MKISILNNVQHRELRPDFNEKFHSNWVDPPWHEVATAEQYSRFYWSAIEEQVYAAKKGFDGIALNEHHQNSFGGLPNPNVFAGALCHATRDLEVAIVQMGSTLTTNVPPNRVAEEYAMLDLLSEGRLIAGMPVGTPMDATLGYGVRPIDQRERYVEAHELILKAWTSTEPFIWNGKYFQLPCVNVWPRPIQQPHPPVWVPGVASGSTWEMCAKYDHGYLVLTAFSGKLGISDSLRLVKGYWERVDAHGHDRNPFRAGIALFPLVGDSMAQIERDYYEHLKYFFVGGTHTAPQHLNPPGCLSHDSLLAMFKAVGKSDLTGGFEDWSFADFVNNRTVVAGTPDEVADEIEAIMKEANAGHLMTVHQIGSMQKEQVFDSIDAFSDLLPRLRPMWEDEWENHWWPERLRKPRSESVAASVGVS
jgi:alkanesulfonate monooxygenase SsuD/methylene tetrahydromethanopterin reductase-like flavin-dependent oxidoreductase (luciferase family)